MPPHLAVLNGAQSFPDVEPTELALAAARSHSSEVVDILGRFIVERVDTDSSARRPSAMLIERATPAAQAGIAVLSAPHDVPTWPARPRPPPASA